MALAKSRQESRQDMKEKNRLYDRSLSGSFAGGMGGSLNSQQSLRGGTSCNSSFHSSRSQKNNGGGQHPNQRSSNSSSKDLDHYIQNAKSPSTDGYLHTGNWQAEEQKQALNDSLARLRNEMTMPTRTALESSDDDAEDEAYARRKLMEFDIDKYGEPLSEVGSQPRTIALAVIAILLISATLILTTYEEETGAHFV